MSIKWNDISSPPHYKNGSIECIDGIKSATGSLFEGYLIGNVIKYLWRCNYKGDKLKDLKKAQWYLNYLIDSQEK